MNILDFNVLVKLNGFRIYILWWLLQAHFVATFLLDLKFPSAALEKK